MNEQKIIKLDVAILGGGFGGVYCAQAISKLLKQKSNFRVGIVSEENYMVFQPMLPEVAGSSISPRHVVNPLRLLCRDTLIFRGRVEEISWRDRNLRFNAGSYSGDVCIEYDDLVLGIGSVTDLSHIPGMPEHAFLMKNVGDAMLLRTTLLGRIEEANLECRREVKDRLLTFVVVGGGYSGVETAGHILDLFHSIQVYYPNISKTDVKVYLVHAGDHLLPTLSRRLGEYSARKLARRGLKVVLNQRVKSVTANRVYLEDTSVIETNTVICTVGNAPHPLTVAMAKQCNLELIKGCLPTEPSGQVRGQPHLWAMGDCAAFPLADGGQSPNTAQFATREGTLVGKNIMRQTRQQTLQPLTYKGLGEMASVGHHLAVAEILGVQFSGFFAWWLWRTVYLLKLPRLDRKVRVMLDWTLDLFFPRDLNHLSPRFSKPVKEIYLERGDILFHKGEPAFSFYIVKSGSVELRENGDVVQRINAGGYFGERALLEDEVWRYDACVLEPTHLVSIPGSVFHQLVRGIGSLGRFFQKSATKYQSKEMVEAINRKIPADIASQPVATVMERKLHTLRPEMTVQEALHVTRKHPRSSYPLVDTARHLLGTVTREDFYEFIKQQNTKPESPIKDMILSQLPTVNSNASVSEVMKCFIRSGSNKVLVLDDSERLQGIVTVMDLIAVGSDGGPER